MSTLTLNRRDFLKVVSVAGGGLVLGFHLLPKETEMFALEAAGSFEPNAFLSIDKTGRIIITVAKSEMGQGVRTSLPMIVAEELEADWTTIEVNQAPAHPNKYGSQGTGGSTSVRTSYENLRKAGATAREMLIAAAAQQWGVDPATCYAERASVIHRGSGRKLSYGELAETAATLPVPASPRLKDPKDFTIIGKRTPQVDNPARVDGTAIFGIDVRVPGMLFVSIEHSPVFGGKVARYDATRAKQVAGVRDVVQIDEGIAVVATNTWAAFEGRDRLDIQWDKGQWAEQSSENIWKTFEETAKKPGTEERKVGDAAAALAGAARKVEAIYRAPFVAHATMEPMNCTAHVRGNKCEIWAPTQTPQRAQTEAARVLGIPVENVTVNVTLLGGGFGRRLLADYVVEAVKVARAVGAPVQVIWTREDDMRHDFYRPSTYNVMTAGLDKNGQPIAWTHRIVGPSSRGLVTGGSTPPYSIPNIYIDAHIIDTGVPIGAWRAVGPSQNAFMVESFIDELAAVAKKDPFEYRRHLLKEKPRLKRALELAAEKAGWGKPLPRGRARGIACCESFGSSIGEVAEVSVDRHGVMKVHSVVVALDCGPVVNPQTIEAQMEGAIAYGLSAVIKDEITIAGGSVAQSNFHDYAMLTMSEMPTVEVHIVPSTESMGGIGEPGLPPVAPAVANAIFALTGKRIRKMPIRAEDLQGEG
jgi:CO/xanthine dehydrogenase Mo-binding subunit